MYMSSYKLHGVMSSHCILNVLSDPATSLTWNAVHDAPTLRSDDRQTSGCMTDLTGCSGLLTGSDAFSRRIRCPARLQDLQRTEPLADFCGKPYSNMLVPLRQVAMFGQPWWKAGVSVMSPRRCISGLRE